MGNPLTRVQHRWVAISITPVVVYRRTDGDVIALADPDTEEEVQIGCVHCNQSPEEGWATLCPGEEEA